MSEMSEALKKEWSVNDAVRDEGLTTPEDVRRFDDILYGPDAYWNLLDIYRPKENADRLPVLIIVHGGAWVYGTKEIYQFYGMHFAQLGFAVVNANYRLAPEHKFPAQLEDINLLVKFVLDNAARYGLDADNVFMAGDSAGAHLLGLYLGICTDPEYAKEYRFYAPSGFLPRAVLMNCGVYDIGRSEVISADGDRMLMQDLMPLGGTEEEIRCIQVTPIVNEAFPPTYLATAKGDFARKQAPFMKEALEKARVPYEYRVYGTEQEPLYHNFEINQKEQEAVLCNREEADFLKKWLKK